MTELGAGFERKRLEGALYLKGETLLGSLHRAVL